MKNNDYQIINIWTGKILTPAYVIIGEPGMGHFWLASEMNKDGTPDGRKSGTRFGLERFVQEPGTGAPQVSYSGTPWVLHVEGKEKTARELRGKIQRCELELESLKRDMKEMHVVSTSRYGRP